MPILERDREADEIVKVVEFTNMPQTRSNMLSRRIVYSIYYNSTLILPYIRGEGRGLEACWLYESRWWERTRDVILLSLYMGTIYTNNVT